MRWIWRLALAVLLLGVAKWGIDSRFQRVVQSAPPVASCDKVWAHRGRLESDPPNTLASAQRLLALGVAGLELDIHYDPEQQHFWVIHDDPSAADKAQRDNLERFLAVLGPAKMGLWLDAKNFASLAPWDAVAAADRLQQLLAQYAPQSRVYVESRNPFYLLLLKSRGVPTSYLISPNSRHAAPVFWLNVYWMKWSYSWGPFDVVSMDIGRYDAVVAEIFTGVPTLLSTINDDIMVAALAAQPNVAALLSDRNVFQVGRCD